MALKLNKGITDSISEVLGKYLEFPVTVEADIGNMTISGVGVKVHMSLPYGISQDLINPKTEKVEETLAFRMIVALFFQRVVSINTNEGLNFEGDIGEWVTSQWVKKYVAPDILPSGKKYALIAPMEAKIVNLWNDMVGTDIEGSFIKTFSGSGLIFLLERAPKGSFTWNTAMGSIGELLEGQGQHTGKFKGISALAGVAAEDKVKIELASEVLVSEGNIKALKLGTLGSPKHTIQVFEDDQIETILSSAPVHLKDSTCLYQPVLATSSDSIYHTIALMPGLAIAARVATSGGISIRAEGDNLKKMSSVLESVGLTVKPKYASMHLHASDKVLQLKTLGAILAALDTPMQCPPAQFSKIIGKGK